MTDENTKDIKEAIVITLKLKSGKDLLAYYGGETDNWNKSSKEIILFRPIWVREVIYNVSGKQAISYQSDLYSLFGGSLVMIPFEEILTKDVASVFFTLYYQRMIGHHLSLEEDVQKSYIKAFTRMDHEEAIDNKDVFLVEPDHHSYH